MSETSTQAPPQERSRDNEHLPFAEQLEAADRARASWYVPDVEDVAYYGELVTKLEVTYHGTTPSYTEHATGNPVDTDLAKRILNISNPYNWCLDKRSTEHFQGIVDASSPRDLDDTQRKRFNSYKQSLPPSERKRALEGLQVYSSAVLGLSDELNDLKSRSGSLPIPQPIGVLKPSRPTQNRHNTAANPIDPAIADAVQKFADLDGNNRPARPDGTPMTVHEFDLVVENLEKINDELNHRDAEQARREIQKQIQLRIHGPTEYQRRFRDNPNVDPEAYREAFKATNPDAILRGRTRPDLPEEVFSENKPANVEQAFWDKLDGATKQAWNGNVLPDAAKQQLKDYLTHQPAGRQRNQEAKDNFAKWYERQIVANAKELYPKNYRVTPEQRKAVGGRANEIRDGQRIKDYREAEAEKLVETYNKKLEESGSDRRLTVAEIHAMGNDKLWDLMVELEPEKYGKEPQDKVHRAKAGRGVGPVPRPTAWETVGDTNLHWSGEGDLDIPPKQRLHRRVGKTVLRAMPFRIVRRT